MSNIIFPNGHRQPPPQPAQQIFACPHCGAAVFDITRHESWHQFVAMSRVVDAAEAEKVGEAAAQTEMNKAAPAAPAAPLIIPGPKGTRD